MIVYHVASLLYAYDLSLKINKSPYSTRQCLNNWGHRRVPTLHSSIQPLSEPLSLPSTQLKNFWPLILLGQIVHWLMTLYQFIFLRFVFQIYNNYMLNIQKIIGSNNSRSKGVQIRFQTWIPGSLKNARNGSSSPKNALNGSSPPKNSLNKSSADRKWYDPPLAKDEFVVPKLSYE